MNIKFGSSSRLVRGTRRRNPLVTLSAAVLLAGAQVMGLVGSAGTAAAAVPFAIQSLDGGGNNIANPTWGQGGTAYARVAAARYADGRSQPVAGPNSRAISNRVFNDGNQNIFSEKQATAWAWTWGQFLDHTFGLRLGRSPGDPAGEPANIPFNANDPLEDFENDLGVIGFTRSDAAPGTGVNNARQQVNTVSSYIDAAAVYGGTNQRLDWLREGSVDGNPANNNGRLLLQNNYLPRRDARGNPAAAPPMEIDGILRANPNRAMVAGDVRANENLFLTATHTLFAREHNRIVNSLPNSLSEEDKFQIARRVIIAEQQYITYNEFLPAMGVSIPRYSGYRNNVNATLTNEFATVGYRVHSMIHGEMEVAGEEDTWTAAQLDAFRAQGIEVVEEDGEVELVIPLNRGFFNPDLVQPIGLGPLLQGIGGEPQYKNEEMIDNQLRSVLFQIPVTGNPECLDGPELPECFDSVVDLGAIDVERGRDHGMPTYNQMRQAYGLPARTSFTQITGESSSAFPPGTGIDNPASLEFRELSDVFGAAIDPEDEDRLEATPINSVRRAPLAARLQAIYGNVNNVDAFVGALAERHASNGDLGELQRAIWAREFTRLRDGDRFFYANDPGLTFIRNTYGIDFRSNLGDIIARNAGVPRSELGSNVFFSHGDTPPSACRVSYTIVNQWPGAFQANMNITNTGSVPINNWTLRFSFANGQQITSLWNGSVVQDEFRVPVENAGWNGTINPGQTVRDVGFTATRNGATNARPTRFSLNTTQCSIG
ncbi:MAG TPA: peroxidase family protein [Actinophytocola sp.]|uniref:peroxidase family protein n=1 Tax=Actinophytocola sp. TaxID=1872138 RepID=UPI002DB712BB|nr:peroxidase family protein [Actinophytocola sp.]HEU5470595.1 peroxidase family protein [Actinophytocola sp.]